ncbi:MAG TPA: hypothetical protein PLJ38_02115, partial [bacterium]|nr:hypothetical protein [bacterium]
MAKFKLNNKFFDIPDDNIEAINSIKADGGILIDKIQTDIQRKQLTLQPTPKQQPQTETYLLQGKKYQIPISETNAINSIKADGGKLIIESIETKYRESLKQNYLNTIKSNLQNIIPDTQTQETQRKQIAENILPQLRQSAEIIEKELKRFNYRPDVIEKEFNLLQNNIKIAETAGIEIDPYIYHLANVGAKQYLEYRKSESLLNKFSDTAEKETLKDILKTAKRHKIISDKETQIKQLEKNLNELKQLNFNYKNNLNKINQEINKLNNFKSDNIKYEDGTIVKKVDLIKELNNAKNELTNEINKLDKFKNENFKKLKSIQSSKEQIENLLKNKNKEEIIKLKKLINYPSRELINKVKQIKEQNPDNFEEVLSQKLTPNELKTISDIENYSEVLETLTRAELKELGFEEKTFFTRIKELTTNFDELVNLIPGLFTLAYTIPKKMIDFETVRSAMNRLNNPNNYNIYKQLIQSEDAYYDLKRCGRKREEYSPIGLEEEQLEELKKENIEDLIKQAQKKDEKIVMDYIEQNIINELTPTTFGYKVADVVALIPGFIKTLNLGGNLTKELNEKITKNILNKFSTKFLDTSKNNLASAVLKKATKKIVSETPAALIKSTAAIPGQIPDILIDAQRRNIETGLEITEDENQQTKIKLNITNKDLFWNLTKATLNQFIENYSEQFGEMITTKKGLSRLANRIEKKRPKLAKLLNLLSNDNVVSKYLAENNIQEIPPEYLEERFGDVLRVITNIDDKKEDDTVFNRMYNAIFPDWEQFAVEAVSFSVLPGAAAAYNLIDKYKDYRRTKDINEFLNGIKNDDNILSLKIAADYIANDYKATKQEKLKMLSAITNQINELENKTNKTAKELEFEELKFKKVEAEPLINYIDTETAITKLD